MENLTPSNFAVVFTEPSPEGIERLRHHYPHLYELVDGSVFVVRHAGLSSEVAYHAGIKSEPRVAEGVVFRLNHAYSGFTAKSLWEWLGEE